jgi:hypothetical protein
VLHADELNQPGESAGVFGSSIEPGCKPNDSFIFSEVDTPFRTGERF